MARIPEGREVLQVTVDTEVATSLRVQAAIRRTTPGRLIEDLVRKAAGRKTLAELLEGTEGVSFAEGGEIVAQPNATTKAAMREADEIMRAKAPGRPQGARRRRGGGDGEVMTWEALQGALDGAGRSQRDLREHLGLSNISQWAHDGVPTRHVPKIKAFLGLTDH